MDAIDPAAARTARLRRLQRLLWALVAVLTVAAAILFSRAPSGAPVTVTRAAPGAPGFQIGGPFALTDADGHRFSSSQLAGRPYVMFFGFTHCPDVCPTTLARLARLRAQFGSPAAFQILFVSIDPARDTPESLKDYAGLFDTPVTMLTGTPAEVAAVAKSHAIYAARRADPASPDGYTMDHSAQALLFDRTGSFTATIAPDEPDAAALAKLKRIAA